MNNVISTRVSVFRNIKDYKFENKLTQEQKEFFSINVLADKIYSHITDTKLNSIYKHKL